jgi:IS5 family transposase
LPPWAHRTLPRAPPRQPNPYDGHALRTIIEETQKLTGRDIDRAYVDKGYRGHDAPKPRRVFISVQRRGVFGAIKREFRRPIGHRALDRTHEVRRASRPQLSERPRR